MSYGQFDAGTNESEFNALSFLIQQALLKMQTVTLVKVVNVHGGGVAPTGTVDVLPMVNQMAQGPNGTRTAVPHGVIYNVPFYRLQGGTGAIICDPMPGDIGLCAFASRDISSVKATLAVANPGSQRTYDWADGLYLGGFLNGTPSQYIQFVPDVGIAIQGANENTGTGGSVNIQGGANETGGQGGDVLITSGEGDVANGYILISAAGGDTPNPGDVFVLTDTTLTLYSNGTMVFVIGGSAGSAGQYLGSDGAGNVNWGPVGVSGEFTTADSKTVTVVNGIITAIV